MDAYQLPGQKIGALLGSVLVQSRGGVDGLERGRGDGRGPAGAAFRRPPAAQPLGGLDAVAPGKPFSTHVRVASQLGSSVSAFPIMPAAWRRTGKPW
ncbi:hypothetical protein [Nonomuraea sp. NPDC050783]|uniref:hypothetical protein n=1 Tax=Nonomuraea sp. NPDC050783 TaxID=3154634 RepID=UPI0034653F78